MSVWVTSVMTRPLAGRSSAEKTKRSNEAVRTKQLDRVWFKAFEFRSVWIAKPFEQASAFVSPQCKHQLDACTSIKIERNSFPDAIAFRVFCMFRVCSGCIQAMAREHSQFANRNWIAIIRIIGLARHSLVAPRTSPAKRARIAANLYESVSICKHPRAASKELCVDDRPMLVAILQGSVAVLLLWSPCACFSASSLKRLCSKDSVQKVLSQSPQHLRPSRCERRLPPSNHWL